MVQGNWVKWVHFYANKLLMTMPTMTTPTYPVFMLRREATMAMHSVREVLCKSPYCDITKWSHSNGLWILTHFYWFTKNTCSFHPALSDCYRQVELKPTWLEIDKHNPSWLRYVNSTAVGGWGNAKLVFCFVDNDIVKCCSSIPVTQFIQIFSLLDIT